MANIVDDEENIKRFMASMNNFVSTFTQGKNYGSSSKGTVKSSTSSAIPSPAFLPTVTDPIDETQPDTLPALTPSDPDLLPKRDPQETLSSWEMVPQETDSPATPARPVPNGRQLHRSGDWSNEISPPGSIQTKNVQSLKVDSAVNKQLLSPQLNGRIAPPPTPETVAHDRSNDRINGHDIPDLLRYHVGQQIESNGGPVGLGESIYATHRSSPLTRIGSSPRPVLGAVDDEASQHIIAPIRQMPHVRRLQRNLSYERLSFSIADSAPFSTLAVNLTPESRNGVNNEPDIASRAVNETKTLAQGDKSTASTAPVVQGIQAAMAAMKAKYGGRSSSASQKADAEPTVQQTLDKTEERVLQSSGASSTTSNESRKPAHLKLGPQTYGSAATPTQPTSNFAPVDTTDWLSPPEAVRVIKVSTSSVMDQARAAAATTGNSLTPSSANFAMISPSTGRHLEAGAVKSAANTAAEGSPIFFGRSPKPEGREAPRAERTAPVSVEGNPLYFGSFPKPESRGRPAARVRRAILSNLPFRCTAKTVASLVYGGQLESIIMKPNACAEVLFVDADECLKFCNECNNGLVYGKGPNDYVLVDPHTEVDVVGGKLSQMVDLGVTRCVLVIGESSKYALEDLWELAQEKNRKVESIDESVTPIGNRVITFRFCKMEDANNFKGVLQRDEDWEHCNIRFAPDPCTTASGPRFDAKA